MTLKFSGFRAVVKVHVPQNFINPTAAVHELSCAQRKTLTKTMQSVATTHSN